MAKKAAERIVDALNQLMEGYVELQRKIDEEIGGAASSTEDEGEEEEDLETEAEVEAAMNTEMRSAVESLLDNEDYSVEEFASLISHLMGALEEIDPDVFSASEGLDEGEEEYDYDEDEDDYDLDEEDEEEPKDEDE